MSGVITGPVALFNNPPIEPQFFQPWRFEISAITFGRTTTVTLTIPAITELNYVVGQQVRFIIPPTFGCRQLNNQTGYILSINLPDQIVVDIDSRGGNPFIASSASTKAQILAIGDINSGQISSTGVNIPLVTIPGAMINISPN